MFYRSLSCLPLSPVFYKPDQKFPFSFLHLLTVVVFKLIIFGIILKV